MIPFFIGLVAFGLALVWLARLKQRDLDSSAAVLGFQRVKDGTTTRHQTAEGWPCRDTVIAAGRLGTLDATLSVRSIPHVLSPAKKRVATQFTLLSLTLAGAPPTQFRLQPVGVAGDLEAATSGGAGPPVVATGDAAFDAAFRLYAETPTAALLVLTAEVRAALVALRAESVPNATVQHLASALLLGTFEIHADQATYCIYGSPTTKTAQQVLRASPLLARLAGAASA
jgi:hypothetical protein